jgi:hypothetical protein
MGTEITIFAIQISRAFWEGGGEFLGTRISAEVVNVVCVLASLGCLTSFSRVSGFACALGVSKTVEPLASMGVGCAARDFGFMVFVINT